LKEKIKIRNGGSKTIKTEPATGGALGQIRLGEIVMTLSNQSQANGGIFLQKSFGRLWLKMNLKD
jgi:hypothetical protein